MVEGVKVLQRDVKVYQIKLLPLTSLQGSRQLLD